MFDHRYPTAAGRTGLASVVLASAVLAFAAFFPALSSHVSGSNPSLTMDAADRATLDGCNQVKIRFGPGGTWETVRSDDKFTVPRSQASTLRVDLARSGGMRVQPWDRPDYEVEVCKGAAGKSRESAQENLDAIQVGHEGGEITSSGPDKPVWAVFLIIRVPRGASMDLATENGEIGVRGVDGTIVAHSQNGPIDLKNCSGQVRARTENGPVAMSGGSGKHDLSTQNGPLAIALAGTSWKGAGVTGKTENGPVALTLAPDYETGVRIDMSGHSPVVCSGVPCALMKGMRRDGLRSIQFGSSDPTIRLSTGNGPVAISGPDDADEDEDGVTWG